MSYQPPLDVPVTGEFIEVSEGLTHSFNNQTDDWGRRHGATHTLLTREGPRPMKLLKTVAYIAVDEDAYGDAVWEKWYIRNRKDF